VRITEQDWKALEADRHASGVVSRRLYPQSDKDIHIAVDQPTGRRMLLLRVAQSSSKRVEGRYGPLPVTRGLEMRFSVGVGGTRDLQVLLTAPSGREVFNPLITDIAAAASEAKDVGHMIDLAIGRFEHWRRLLEAIRDSGLSAEQRRGLYGELYTLRDLMLSSLSEIDAVQSWTGPTGADQDFQFEGAAIEVKTGVAKSPQTLVIANERQLDDTGMRHLVLAHIWVDERRGNNGESLNRIVADIRSRLGDTYAGQIFDDLLIRAGYLIDQSGLYDEPCNIVRRRSFWRVANNFPRIVQADLRDGVGECRYRINPVRLDPYRITMEDVVGIVRGLM